MQDLHRAENTFITFIWQSSISQWYDRFYVLLMSFIAGVYVDLCQQYWPVASENLTTACLYFCLFVKPFTRLEVPQVTTVPFRRLLWKCERSVNVLVRDGNLSDNDWAPAVILVSGYPTSDGQYWRFRLIIISPHLGGDIAKISFWMQREISFNFMVSHSERFINISVGRGRWNQLRFFLNLQK